MKPPLIPVRPVQEAAEAGCAYILDEGGSHQRCGATRRLGSSYCPPHYDLCHVRCGTREEVRHLREVEVLANAVGGRRARGARGPSQQFLRRLEHAVRVSP